MSGEEDDDQLVIYFQKPIPPCRVPVKRPDGRVVLVSLEILGFR